MKQTGNMAKITKDVVLLMLIIFKIGLSNARSTGNTKECKPPDPTRDGYGCEYHYCDDTLYFFDKDREICKECKKCPIGEEPEYHCQKDVDCKPCGENHFSDSENQEGCTWCSYCVNREILAECTPTSDTECGGCLSGFYLNVNNGYCDPCEDQWSNEEKILKGCPTSRPPTTKQFETTVHTTTKQTTSKISTAKVATTTDLHTTSKQTTTSLPSKSKQTQVPGPKNLRTDAPDPKISPPGVQKHEEKSLGHLGIILLTTVVMLGLCILAVVYIVKTCVNKWYNDSGKQVKPGIDSGFTSGTRTTRYSGSSGSNDESSFTSSSGSLDKRHESDNEHNVNMTSKNSPKADFALQMETLETQNNQNDEKQQQQQQQRMTCSTPPGNSSDTPVESQYNKNQNFDFNNLNTDRTVKQKQEKVCSAPEASVKVENDVRSSGEDSDSGLGERASLLNGGTPAIKPKRRLSNSRYFSLSSAGGVFSSGSGTDTPDSIVSRSINDTSSGSCTQSLSSDPSRATKGKRNKLKKQNSYDNGVMEKLDVDNEVTNTSPLLECNESPNGPVMQESSDDRKQAEAVYLSNQQLNHLQSASNQGPSSEDHTPQDSIAKCNIEANQTDRIDNSPPQSPISANLSAPPPLQHPGRSPNRVPVGHGRHIPRTPSPKRPSRLYPSVSSASSYLDSLPTEVPVDIGHTRRCPTTSATPIIVNKYYAPVTQYQASNGGQIAVGNNCNQIQQQGPGGVDSHAQPRTPEGSVPCSDDFRATYPSDGNPLT